MKIILTGGSGFLGKLLNKKLINHQVFNYDIIDGYDILNKEQLEKTFSEYNPDTIIHLAACSDLNIYRDNPDISYKINVIGTRHGEKRFEVLLSREEMSKAEDLNNFYRIRPDLRDLNYGKFIEMGKLEISGAEDYNSDNTKRLDFKNMQVLLKKLPFIKSILIEQTPNFDE